MNKPFFHNEKLCKGCQRVGSITDVGGRRDKWFCFGITTPESRKAHDIPSYDNLRFCVKHPPLSKLPVKNLFQLNMNEVEVKELIDRFSRLLQSSKAGSV